jgi:hypothetical protein
MNLSSITRTVFSFEKFGAYDVCVSFLRLLHGYPMAGGADVRTEVILGAAPFGFKGAVLKLSRTSSARVPNFSFFQENRSAAIPVPPSVMRPTAPRPIFWVQH